MDDDGRANYVKMEGEDIVITKEELETERDDEGKAGNVKREGKEAVVINKEELKEDLVNSKSKIVGNIKKIWRKTKTEESDGM